MTVRMEFDVTGMAETESALRELGVEIMPASRRQIYNSLLSLRNRLTASAPRPSGKIDWDSEKQRRAYFATDGFGGGIPSRRTGRYQQSWRVVRLGSDYAIENPVDYAVYVGGNFDHSSQSRIHKSRWPLWAAQLEKAVGDMPAEIEGAVQGLAKEKGL